jgi:PAS domain S-box-containing protein
MGGIQHGVLTSEPARPVPVWPAAGPGLTDHELEAGAFLIESAESFLAVNHCACALLGWTREELLAQRPANVVLAPELIPAEAAVETGAARLRRRDGEIIAVRYEARDVALGHTRAALWLVSPLEETAPPTSTRKLTPRELQILQLLADGADTYDIARALRIAPETVKTHVRRLLPKLDARSRTHAVAIAFRRALVQ